jgi:hypothetical protein
MANKTVVLKYGMSGTYHIHGDENMPIGGYEYPEPLKEVKLPENVADSLIASGAAWTPAQFKKVSKKN